MIVLTALLTGGWTGAAMAETYVCKMSTKNGNWFPSLIQVDYTPDNRLAHLTDLTRSKDKQRKTPIELTRDNDRKASFRFVAHNVRNSANQHSTALRFSLSIKKSNGAAHVNMRPQGYSNTLRTRGVCKQVTGA